MTHQQHAGPFLFLGHDKCVPEPGVLFPASCHVWLLVLVPQLRSPSQERPSLATLSGLLLPLHTHCLVFSSSKHLAVSALFYLPVCPGAHRGKLPDSRNLPLSACSPLCPGRLASARSHHKNSFSEWIIFPEGEMAWMEPSTFSCCWVRIGGCTGMGWPLEQS